VEQQEKGLNEDWSVTTRQAFYASMSHTPIITSTSDHLQL